MHVHSIQALVNNKRQGRGYLKILQKSLGGGSRFSRKIARGGLPYSGFIAFLLTSVLKFV
jgi:hypothetical protein